MTSVPPIIAPLSDADWPPELLRLRADFAGKLNVYRTMAHHPALLAAWETLRNHVVIDSTLGPEQREIVILRVGHRWGSSYEWGQHVVRGRAAGLSDARIAAVREAPGEGDDSALMQAVDELLDAGQLSATTLARLHANVGIHGVLDVMATVGMYTTLAFIVNTFETPLEPEMADELSVRPLLQSGHPVDSGSAASR